MLKNIFSILSCLTPSLGIVAYHISLKSLAAQSSWGGEIAANAVVGLIAVLAPLCLFVSCLFFFFACRRKERLLLLSALGWPFFFAVLAICIAL